MKLENPSVTGVEAGGAPAVIRTKLSNATLVEVPSHVSRFGYDRRRLRSGIVHIGVGNFFRALVDEPLMTIEGLMGAEKITNTEMPATAVFLALRQSAYIVGQTINVDGGNIMS